MTSFVVPAWTHASTAAPWVPIPVHFLVILMRFSIMVPTATTLLPKVPIAAVLTPAPPIIDADESMDIVTLMLPLDAFVHSPVPARLWYLVPHVNLNL